MLKIRHPNKQYDTFRGNDVKTYKKNKFVEEL
jgi:hypothetical protein